MSLVNSKSLLAKLLATENITVETRKVSTASFDLKNRTLTIPDWEGVSDFGYDLLLGHEVGHALDTPFVEWSACIDEKPYLKRFVNVVEDSRIERRIKRRYPGLRKSFFKGYEEFLQKDLFGIKDRNVNDLFFVDRLNIFCKSGSQVSIDFTDEELSLVNLVESTETFEEVVAAAQAVYDYSKIEQQEEKKEKEEEEGKEEGEEENSDTDQSEKDEGGTEDSGESEETEYTEKSLEFSDEVSEDDEGEAEAAEIDEEEASAEEYSNGFVPVCETDENFEQTRKSLAHSKGAEYVYVKYPSPVLKNIVTPIKRVHELLKKDFVSQPDYVASQVQHFKKRNSRYIDLLSKEFEMRKAAKRYAKTKITNTGDIDISKIYKYRSDDKIFRRNSVTPKGKNHGMVILLDRSGSMSDNMKNSLEQLVIMAQFCKRVGVPFVVYGFGDNRSGYLIDNSSTTTNVEPSFTKNPHEIKLKNVFLREYLNSNMRSSEFTESCNNIIALASLYSTYFNYGRQQVPLQEQLSSTPLNEALLALAPITKEFKIKNGLEIVSTVIIQDGDADFFQQYYHDANGDPVWMNRYYENMILNEKIDGKIFQRKIFFAENDHFNETILDYYRQYTGTKVVGIFLMNKRQIKKTIMKTSHTMEQAIEFREKMNNDRFFATKQTGYNNFFYVLGGNDMSDSNEISIDSDMSVSKIKTAFLKNNQKKLTNRLLVSQLIAEISVDC